MGYVRICHTPRRLRRQPGAVRIRFAYRTGLGLATDPSLAALAGCRPPGKAYSAPAGLTQFNEKPRYFLVEKILGRLVIPALYFPEIVSCLLTKPSASFTLVIGAWFLIALSGRSSHRRNILSRKTIIISQIFITFMMATLMSGTMSLIALGPTTEWLAAWPRQIVIAWPIAFIFTQLTAPLAFALTNALLRKSS